MSLKRLLLAAWAGAFALLAGCARQLPPDPVPGLQLVQWDRSWSYQGVGGQEILTEHYRIFTTHSDPVFLERLPLFLETAFRHYQRLIKPSRRPDGAMDVYLFGRREQWEQFTAQTTGAAAAIYRKIQEGGYVDGGRAVFYDIDRQKTFAVTGHEGFHQYVSHYTRHRPPAWLDEGLACYFETFNWDGNTLTFQPRQNFLRLRALREGLTPRGPQHRDSLLDLSELLATHPGNIIGGSPSKVASYYAQVWAMVLFLQDDPACKGRFARLLAETGTDRMIERAGSAGYRGQTAEFGPAIFRAYITTDLAGFEARFRAYCLKLAGF